MSQTCLQSELFRLLSVVYSFEARPRTCCFFCCSCWGLEIWCSPPTVEALPAAPASSFPQRHFRCTETYAAEGPLGAETTNGQRQEASSWGGWEGSEEEQEAQLLFSGGPVKGSWGRQDSRRNCCY